VEDRAVASAPATDSASVSQKGPSSSGADWRSALHCTASAPYS